VVGQRLCSREQVLVDPSTAMPSIDGKAKTGERSMEMSPDNSQLFHHCYSFAKKHFSAEFVQEAQRK
jgi:hypothetical protein